MAAPIPDRVNTGFVSAMHISLLAVARSSPRTADPSPVDVTGAQHETQVEIT
jgi:hypothetical protein